MSETTIQPFGHFKSEAFGWTDCAETDEGARPLYDQAAIDALTKQRDDLLAAVKPFSSLLKEHHDRLPDIQPIYGIGDSLITVGDLRRANAAIESMKDHSEVLLGMVKGGAA